MFLESDRVQIRHFLGYPAIFLQADPRLESAISAVQAVTDPGGTRPDASTENFIRTLLVDAQTIEARLRALWAQAQVLGAKEARIDPYRGMAMLRSEGRRVVAGICRQLGTSKRADAFSGAPANDTGDTFYELASGGAPPYQT